MWSIMSRQSSYSIMSHQSTGATLKSRSDRKLPPWGPPAIVAAIVAVAGAGYLASRSRRRERS
jgi:hypothetical protein